MNLVSQEESLESCKQSPKTDGKVDVGSPETDGKVEKGKVYDFHKKYGEIDTQLLMNTIGIYIGLIPDDIDPQAMTQDDLDYYFYDRTR